MKTLNRFIIEKLKLGKDVQIKSYNFYPKDFNELRSLIEQLLKERGANADLNDIDISQITMFYDPKSNKGLFEDLDPVDLNISNWDVSNVENMRFAFLNCENFDCDLSNWDVSKVEDMRSMFNGNGYFTGKGLEKWNVSNVEDMKFMFYNCENFIGKGLENWDVSNVEKMQRMFCECKKLNCDLSNWDVNNVKDMHSMFVNCKNFNCDLSNWDISNVKDMRWMFDGCDSLKNIPSWYKE